jgi:iron complex transport system substrate-binding protein
MRIKSMVGVLAGLSLLAAACGDDDTVEPAAEPAAVSAESVTAVESESASVAPDTDPATTEPAVPTAIISLSPTATEMVYAIGAGDQVLAVDDFSNYPEAAAATMQGISGFEPNVEAIAGLEPDLVLTDGTNPDFLAQLDSLGIAHWEGQAATSFDEIYSQIEQLGAATGHVGEAAELVAQMQVDIEQVVAALPVREVSLRYYHELDATYFSATSQTFIGLVYGLAGLENIADAAAGDAGPYPQLTAEYIVEANPDLIFNACSKYCGETPETIAARPGWDAISAVVNGNVINMDDDIASRWGPRIVEYIRQVGVAVTTASLTTAASQPAG